MNWYATARLNWEEENTAGNDSESREQVEQHGFKMQSNIIHPALMVTAGKDGVLRPELTHGMEKWCVGGFTRKHIEESMHWIQIEQADEVNRILLEWIDKLPPIEENIKAASQSQPNSRL